MHHKSEVKTNKLIVRQFKEKRHRDFIINKIIYNSSSVGRNC